MVNTVVIELHVATYLIKGGGAWGAYTGQWYKMTQGGGNGFARVSRDILSIFSAVFLIGLVLNRCEAKLKCHVIPGGWAGGGQSLVKN